MAEVASSLSPKLFKLFKFWWWISRMNILACNYALSIELGSSLRFSYETSNKQQSYLEGVISIS